MSKKKYADCIVMNTDNEVLLLQRSSNDEFMPSKWCLPGGHVDDGEEIDQVESPLEFIEKLDGHFEIISKAFDADEIDADVYMSYLRRYKKLRIEKSIEIIKTAFDSDQINEHQYIDAIRKAKTITEPLDDLIAEHKHLVKVLKTGNKKAGKEEAKEQGEELKEFEKDKKGTEE